MEELKGSADKTYRERGAYYGIIGGVWAVASSLGPIIGGLFAEKVTWRWW